MIRVWLRDDQFERIAALLPGKVSDPGRTAADNRLFVEAVLWIARTGSPWRDLPPSFGLWNSVYQRFARWSRSGVWHRVFAQLALDADFEEVFIDSTIVRAHQHAAGAPKKRRPSARALPGRTEYQDSRRGGGAGVTRPLQSDRRRSRRQSPGTAPAGRPTTCVAQCGQGLRYRCHPPASRRSRHRGRHPAAPPSSCPTPFRSRSLQEP